MIPALLSLAIALGALFSGHSGIAPSSVSGGGPEIVATPVPTSVSGGGPEHH
jgi:hypothetical protein